MIVRPASPIGLYSLRSPIPEDPASGITGLGLTVVIFREDRRTVSGYRPPQYRKVMLPLIVLRRLDCVLEPTKEQVLKQVAVLKAKKLSPEALEKALAKVASKDRDQPLFNVSPYTFPKLLGESTAIAKNLTAYIKGFSPNVRKIFEKFEFEAEIEKLDENNMLFEIIKEFSTLDLHPDTVPNLEMGYLFEYLIRKFNEQANEEAGDHFTPREVIRLMAHSQPARHC